MKTICISKKRHIGERLRYLRGDISQTDMAKQLQVTQSYLSQVELGKKVPSLETLLYLAERQHTTVGFLLGETNDPSPASDQSQMTELLQSEVPSIFRMLQNSEVRATKLTDATVSAVTLLALLKDKLTSDRETFTAQETDLLRSLLEICTSAINCSNKSDTPPTDIATPQKEKQTTVSESPVA